MKRCPACGKVLLSNAVAADTEELIFVHPRCWRVIISWRDFLGPWQ